MTSILVFFKNKKIYTSIINSDLLSEEIKHIREIYLLPENYHLRPIYNIHFYNDIDSYHNFIKDLCYGFPIDFSNQTHDNKDVFDDFIFDYNIDKNKIPITTINR